ncbi:universal stress protein [Rathayibacter sp. AY1E9]|uniref:universal stress protein n=1 Tax=unclassified Rathayibacter TaxID=2609250 RepID=UPI000CE9344B|nr:MULTISPECIES: universal stress protein [unclassified Rathayibacter]PPG51953.1 universal stress protein [Rathayibacter sp. AY1E9]PPG54714.1 universal stress protein [Rathayibacter sp. AY1C5]
MTAPTPTGPVLVGIVDGQRPEVLRTAARVAADAGAALLLVSVSADPYLVGEYVDPMTGGIPLGFVGAAADRGEGPSLPPGLRETVEHELDGSTVQWSLRAARGEPALTLAEVAEEVDARMIVVGTRDAGVLASIAEFLSGSVAAHLAHRQHRPVLVVPRADRDPSRPAPWDLAE